MDPSQPGKINNKEKGFYSLPTEMLFDIIDSLPSIKSLGNLADAARGKISIDEYSRDKISDLYAKRVRHIDFLPIYSYRTLKKNFVIKYFQTIRCDR